MENKTSSILAGCNDNFEWKNPLVYIIELLIVYKIPNGNTSWRKYRMHLRSVNFVLQSAICEILKTNNSVNIQQVVKIEQHLGF